MSPDKPRRSEPNPSGNDLLPGWQRPVVRALVVSFLVMGTTGLYLTGSDGASGISAVALAIHVVAGVLALPLLLAFVIPHARAHMKRKPVIAFSGTLVLFVALAIAYTGAELALSRVATRPEWTMTVHWACGGLLLLLYPLHRRFGKNPAPWPRLAGAVGAVLVMALVLERIEASSPEGAQIQAFDAAAAGATGIDLSPSSSRIGTGRLVEDMGDFMEMDSCARCHEAIVRDHLRSAHRHSSFNNIFYRRTIEDMRTRFGIQPTLWCAGCHDPAMLFTGKMVEPELDMESPEAQAGLTCMACHAIETQGILGNGDYVLRERRIHAWEKSSDPAVRAAHDVLLKMKPEGHVAGLRPHDIAEGRFCGTCHRADLPPEVNGWHLFRAQTEYDDWDDSGVSLNNVRSFYHPAAAKRCQDCHMPPRLAPDDPAADADGYVKSHLFGAANTAMAFIRGDQEMIDQQTRFLRTALRVDIAAVVLPPLAADHGEDASREDASEEAAGNDAATAETLPGRLIVPAWRVKPAVEPDQVVEAHVVVRNIGVGHRFPAGTIDSNEIWVLFEASVGDGSPFYVSGAIDPATGHVDETSEFYRSYAMTRDGKRFTSRVGLDVFTPLYARRIGPGTADVVRYRFRVPAGASGPLRMKATVRYRKFMPQFLESIFPEGMVIDHIQMDGSMAKVDLRQLPIVDMAEGALELPVAGEGFALPAPQARDVATAEDLLRVNDLAIAYLLQQDPLAAEPLFAEVTAIDPQYADGWVNVARARIMLNNLDGALESLARAEALRPGWGKSAFFEAEVAMRQLDWQRAEVALRRTLEQWPRDRQALRNLARVLWETDRPAEALAVLDRLLEINPKDEGAWFQTIAALKVAGDEERLPSAIEAYNRYRPDDTLPARAGEFLVADPNLNNLSLPIHVHRAPDVGAYE